MNNQEYELDKHYNPIASLFMLVCYCTSITLVTFDVISYYWIWLVILFVAPIRNIIQKQIKQYCIQNKIPTPKIVKLGKISNWVFYLTLIPIAIFCFGYIILYK